MHLIFCQGSNNQRAHHPRKCSYAVRNAHQDAGIARSNIQMVDIKTWKELPITKWLQKCTWLNPHAVFVLIHCIFRSGDFVDVLQVCRGILQHTQRIGFAAFHCIIHSSFSIMQKKEETEKRIQKKWLSATSWQFRQNLQDPGSVHGQTNIFKIHTDTHKWYFGA